MPFTSLLDEASSSAPGFTDLDVVLGHSLKVQDLRDAAFNILGTNDEAHALALIREAVNWAHAGLDGDHFPELNWDDDLFLRDKAALIWVMRRLVRSGS